MRLLSSTRMSPYVVLGCLLTNLSAMGLAETLTGQSGRVTLYTDSKTIYETPKQVRLESFHQSDLSPSERQWDTLHFVRSNTDASSREIASEALGTLTAPSSFEFQSENQTYIVTIPAHSVRVFVKPWGLQVDGGVFVDHRDNPRHRDRIVAEFRQKILEKTRHMGDLNQQIEAGDFVAVRKTVRQIIDMNVDQKTKDELQQLTQFTMPDDEQPVGLPYQSNDMFVTTLNRVFSIDIQSLSKKQLREFAHQWSHTPPTQEVPSGQSYFYNFLSVSGFTNSEIADIVKAVIEGYYHSFFKAAQVVIDFPQRRVSFSYQQTDTVYALLTRILYQYDAAATQTLTQNYVDRIKAIQHPGVQKLVATAMGMQQRVRNEYDE